MKISVVTATFNCADTVEDCIRSVLDQTHPDVEHVIIDGGSTDGTLDIIQRYEDRIAYWRSEPDRGIYDALNKGIRAATGDVVGTLGADDLYADERAVRVVAEAFMETGCDSCYGDILLVDCRDVGRIVRYWVASDYVRGRFRWGWMPPHPTFFVKREILERYGGYRTSFRISADYELMLRLLEKHGISTRYIPEVLIRMRVGGASTSGTRSFLTRTYEDCAAWKINGLQGTLLAVLAKKLRKIPQFLKRNRVPP